jgi:hypothetical protein
VFWHFGGGADHLEQAFDCVVAVALLGAESLGVDDQHALLGHAVAGEADQPRLQSLRQRW